MYRRQMSDTMERRMIKKELFDMNEILINELYIFYL